MLKVADRTLEGGPVCNRACAAERWQRAAAARCRRPVSISCPQSPAQQRSGVPSALHGCCDPLCGASSRGTFGPALVSGLLACNAASCTLQLVQGPCRRAAAACWSPAAAPPRRHPPAQRTLLIMPTPFIPVPLQAALSFHCHCSRLAGGSEPSHKYMGQQLGGTLRGMAGRRASMAVCCRPPLPPGPGPSCLPQQLGIELDATCPSPFCSHAELRAQLRCCRPHALRAPAFQPRRNSASCSCPPQHRAPAGVPPRTTHLQPPATTASAAAAGPQHGGPCARGGSGTGSRGQSVLPGSPAAALPRVPAVAPAGGLAGAVVTDAGGLPAVLCAPR